MQNNQTVHQNIKLNNKCMERVQISAPRLTMFINNSGLEGAYKPLS